MKHAKKRLSVSQEVEFNIGYLYRTIEEHIESFAVQAGDKITVADIADRLGQLLRIKAENVRAISGTSQLLQQMRENGETISEGAAYIN